MRLFMSAEAYDAGPVMRIDMCFFTHLLHNCIEQGWCAASEKCSRRPSPIGVSDTDILKHNIAYRCRAEVGISRQGAGCTRCLATPGQQKRFMP